MNLLPRTLFGRNLLLIAALIVFSELVVAIAFVVWISVQRTLPLIESAQHYATAIAGALDALPPERRDAYRQSLEAGGAVRIAAADAVPPFEPRPRPAIAIFMRQLRARLPAGCLAGWQASPPTLWLNPALGGDRYWIGLPAAGYFLRAPGFVLAEVAAAIALALVGALVLQRRIDRPLRELARAAATVGAGRPAPLLPENGPLEIAQLARAFNRMAQGLDALDRERALMLAGISHDLRTPLAKIRLALELIGPAAEAGLRASIERSVDSANRVIDQFIAFARPDEGESPVATDLDALVRAVATEMQSVGSPIKLELGRPAALPLRPLALRRLLANLIDNAQKHAAGPLSIRTGAAGAAVVLSVIDGGPGIAPGDAERLKRPFVRSDPARGGSPGAGLGLAIVDRIARAQGGRLELLAAGGPADRPGLEARVTIPRGAA